MDFTDATLPIMKYLSGFEEFKSVRAYKIYSSDPLPCLMVKQTGNTTIQLLVRADSDIEALDLLQMVGNDLKRNFASVDGINILDIDFQSTPLPDIDEDTQKYEAWCYMNIKYFES